MQFLFLSLFCCLPLFDLPVSGSQAAFHGRLLCHTVVPTLLHVAFTHSEGFAHITSIVMEILAICYTVHAH